MRTRLYTYLFISFFILSACVEADFSDLGDHYTVSSDLETVITTDEGVVFATSIEELYIKNGDFVSTDFARSGTQCIKLDSNQVYGLNVMLPKVKAGQFINATVWQRIGYADGTLVATVNREASMLKYRSFYPKGQVSENGWVKHNLSFVVAEGAETVSFFIFSGKKETYFDDIKIEILPQVPDNQLSGHLNLSIPQRSKFKLDSLITDALHSQIIPSSSKKYVKAFLMSEDDSLKVKMKLKGDWTDHIKSGKTSYRVKMKGNHSFNGLKSFSIQHPRTRNYVNEWILHQFADMEDILTTDYDFVNVSINDIKYGVYAIEEHFDKQLIESRKRREGPILKFDESGAWAYNYLKYEMGSKLFLPYFESSVVSVFKSGRTLGTPSLYANFMEGQNLLNGFKNGTIPVDQIFEIDLLAKFYAMIELTGNNHALAWHNRRFYFNPVTQKLEHILYDLIPYSRKNFRTNNVETKLTNKPDQIEHRFDYPVFMNHTFKDKYLFYLDKMTRKEYLDSMFLQIEDQLNLNISALQSEDSTYTFDREEYYKNADYQRSRMKGLDSLWRLRINETNSIDDYTLKAEYQSTTDSFFVKEISVNAYLEIRDSSNYMLALENYHINPISIVGYITTDKRNKRVNFEKPIELRGFDGNVNTVKVNLAYEPKKLIMKVDNIKDQLVKKAIIPWPKPGQNTARLELTQTFSKSNALYSLSGHTISFSGDLEIDQLIYIPKDYKVKILEGSNISFVNGGGLIVNNSFEAIGSSKRPINFICKDSSSQGISIINEDEHREAVFIHVNCYGLSNLKYKNWQLTGAVNVYQTSTYISHLTIEGNQSEDALNIIRSTFKIDHLAIRQTASDGFDADFCDGIITDSEFKQTGNDCIDFSGSEVKISNINIIDSGDKGISGGEGSTLFIDKISIDGAITGIASKDNSMIKGTSIQISKAEYGLAAFQKKGEYAPAQMDLKDTHFEQIGTVKLLDKNSEIKLNGTSEKGTVKVDVDKLYERFN